MDKIVHYSNLFKDFFNVAVGSLLIILVKRLMNRVKHRKELNKLVLEETNTRLSMLENALIALQHDRLYRLTEEYIERGYVSLDELDNLEYIYTSYKALGGNGSGERRYNLVQKLPIINEGDNDD
jgi:hypothetical protein